MDLRDIAEPRRDRDPLRPRVPPQQRSGAILHIWPSRRRQRLGHRRNPIGNDRRRLLDIGGKSGRGKRGSGKQAEAKAHGKPPVVTGREAKRGSASGQPSLRAKRSNPVQPPRPLDCFVATLLAMTAAPQHSTTFTASPPRLVSL